MGRLICALELNFMKLLMNKEELKKIMIIKIGKERKTPLFVIILSDIYIIATYQRTLSEYDIVIKYHSDSNLTKDF